MKRSILLLTTLLVTPSLFAGGYRVSLQGQKTLGMAHAGVALSESSETVFFNPAGMSQLDSDMAITAGITFVDSVIKYQNTNTNSQAETDSPVGTPLNFYLTKKYSDKLSLGLGIYTPYGNTVEYQDDWVGSHLVNNITLKAVYIQPTASFKLNEKYSIGLGPTIVQGEVEQNKNLSTALVDSNGNRSEITISDSGITAYGYNIGFLAKLSDDFSWGVSYRSEVTMEARGGKAEFANIPASQQALFSNTTFDADLVLPAELNIGLAFKASEDTTIAVEFNKAYWSAYKSLDVTFANNVPKSVQARNYVDANTLRIGVQHDYSGELTLRTGIYFDQSPIEEGYFSPETPRNNSVGYTFGASYQMSKQLELDFSMLILTFNEIDASYDHIINSDNTVTSFAGTYQSAATSLGFGINYLF